MQVVSMDTGVAYEDFHQCILTRNGRVAGRGSNRTGQLGVSSQYLERSFAFRPVSGLERIVRIGLDLALSEDGLLYAWANRAQPEPLEFSASVRTFSGRHAVLSNNLVVLNLEQQVAPPNEQVRQITPSGCVLVGERGAGFCWRNERWDLRHEPADEPVRNLLDDNVHRVTQSGKLLREEVVIAEGVEFAAANSVTVCIVDANAPVRLDALGSEARSCGSELMVGR